MNQRQLAVDERSGDDVARFVDGDERTEDLAPLGVSPPAAADLFAGDEFGERGNAGVLRRLQHDAVPLDERERVVRRAHQPLDHLRSASLPSCQLQRAISAFESCANTSS